MTKGQHHFEQSENIIAHSSGHKTMLLYAANDLGLRPMMLRYAQMEDQIFLLLFKYAVVIYYSVDRVLLL